MIYNHINQRMHRSLFISCFTFMNTQGTIFFIESNDLINKDQGVMRYVQRYRYTIDLFIAIKDLMFDEVFIRARL